MNRRIASFGMMSTFLLFALVTAASAQTRTAGVSVGNKFRYSVSVSWSSNDPNATPSQDIIDHNNTLWTQLEVTAISGTNITAQGTVHYKNGTEITSGGSIDVNTGSGNLTGIIISADLGVGDSLYNSSTFNVVIINETEPRWYSTYLSRDTNHLNMTVPVGAGVNQTVNDYWDRSTGVLVEGLMETVNQTATYTTTSSVHMYITSSDVWTVPEFPTWTPVLVILILVTSGTMIVAGINCLGFWEGRSKDKTLPRTHNLKLKDFQIREGISSARMQTQCFRWN